MENTVHADRRQTPGFPGNGHGLFGSWIKWWLPTIITLGIYGLWLPVSLEKWKACHTDIAADTAA